MSDNIQTAVNLGLAQGEPRRVDVDGVPYVVVPEGMHVQGLESFLAMPAHKRAVVTTPDVETFLEYLKQQATSETRIFARDAETPTMDAVIDYHGDKESPNHGWGYHTVKLQCQFSEEWRAWSARHGVWMNQGDFADFLEERIADVAQPSGAQLLEVAQTLQARKTVQFHGGVNLANSTVQLTWNEEMETRAGASGEIAVPTRLTLGMPIYRGGAAYKVEATLRIRVEDRRVQFRIYLPNTAKLLRFVWDEVLEQVETQSGIKPFLGTVSMVRT